MDAKCLVVRVVFILLEKFAFYLLKCKLIQQAGEDELPSKNVDKAGYWLAWQKAVFDHHESMQIQVVGLKASLAILLSPTIKYVDKN